MEHQVLEEHHDHVNGEEVGSVVSEKYVDILAVSIGLLKLHRYDGRSTSTGLQGSERYVTTAQAQTSFPFVH